MSFDLRDEENCWSHERNRRDETETQRQMIQSVILNKALDVKDSKIHKDKFLKLMSRIWKNDSNCDSDSIIKMSEEVYIHNNVFGHNLIIPAKRCLQQGNVNFLYDF